MMRRKFAASIALPLLVLAGSVACPMARAADADADIRDVLANQVDAWNKGDLESFIQGYAENCTFMGSQIVRSREKVLARYRKVYPTSAKMGKLTFSNLDVREIGEKVAIVTGNWHLTRAMQAGGEAGGYFSLVFRDMDDEWKIVLDHTSAEAVGKAH
jgi:uncharacterized protein (TIGR02246 family)